VRVLQIQGLRALAAIIVTLFHARLVPGGFIGVDIFYVISGYLITGLILRELESTGKLDLSAFYQRRIKRLLPTSIFVLFATALVSWFVLPSINRDQLGRDFFAAAAYISNYLFAWWQNDYQNLDATPSPFIHYWSLAVEEQFYLLWPLFLIFLARKGKRAILIGILTITALSLALSIFQTQSSPIWAFYSLPTRAWELGIGALLLFIPPRIFSYRLLPWVGFIALLVASFSFSDRTAFPGTNALLPVLGTALLIATIAAWPPILNDLSNNRLSQWLGKISYPLYLWHWPALVIPSTALGRPLTLLERTACIIVTVILADITNRVIEEPLRHKKFAPKKIYIAALATTATSLVLAVFISTSVPAVVSTSGNKPFTFDLAEVVAKPIVVGDGCHVSHRGNKSGYCTYGDINSKKTIVLYGDSHAAQWFPALEKIAIKRGYKLVSLTKSACPAVDAPRDDDGGFKYINCAQWREYSYQRIKKIKPVAVIMSSFQYFTAPAKYPDPEQWWRNGQLKLLNSLKGASENLIYISDTPHPKVDIPSCLATQVAKECDTSEKSVNRVIPGFKVIDPTPWLCSAICPAVKDSIVAYRDRSHISIAMSIHLMPLLESALKENGLFA
jgi:peptidoglycan/LPS O-acetylase OafA/YrhL